ncbi:alkaline phytoceramidase [Dechloromonas sp. H13]|uniref:alkaline phytoceramidase n=1 Tax=Dechloromonas sp. H13 TaxID=2570193 RepID=UPI001291CA5D|nr:alkaline phytoceramidase [Dechloromonas sp. H13]
MKDSQDFHSSPLPSLRGRAMNIRFAAVIALTVVALVAAFLLPAVRQPLEYHDFADHRHLLGVDNFLDVVSNIGFLVFGVLGLAIVASRRTCFASSGERWPYAVFFVGVLLTALGSGYYHLAPDNETLFWDRLPMTIAFMGLVASQIVDRINVRFGLALLLPMLLVGAASVVYWRISERMGTGNVLPYGILQGYSVIILLLLAVLHPSRYTRGNDIYWVFGWYVLSKVLETFDGEVLAFAHVVSGHTLKHLAAAAAAFAVCLMLMRRTLKDDGLSH